MAIGHPLGATGTENISILHDFLYDLEKDIT